jgi:hypothetical protein
MSEIGRVRVASTVLGLAYTALVLVALAGFGAAMVRLLR